VKKHVLKRVPWESDNSVREYASGSWEENLTPDQRRIIEDINAPLNGLYPNTWYHLGLSSALSSNCRAGLVATG